MGLAAIECSPMNLDYTIYPTKFPDYWDFVLSRTYGTCVCLAYEGEILLYGVLLVLLAIASYLLYQRTGAGRRSLAAATAVMAALATAQLGVHIWGTVLAFKILELAVAGEVLSHSPRVVGITNVFVNLYTVEDFLLVTNNVIADSLFTYRCFVVWGRNARIVALPIFMVVATGVLGYLCAYEDDYVNAGTYIDFRVAFLMSVSTNFVLMALTAGRIWWIRRDASILGLSDSAFVQRYNTIIAIILESGAIYCIGVIIYVIFVSVLNPGNFTPLIDIGRAAVPQIMNIAPTLIIVRVGLGYGVADTAAVSTLRARPGASTGVPFRNPTHSGSVVLDIRAGDADVSSIRSWKEV
ncbi:hypothetical protein FB451DRAFT_1316923 [Mycena latifolia]|nr:hypothetical protein FB451DRAFT_1316923 [Mycena latifolia]